MKLMGSLTSNRRKGCKRVWYNPYKKRMEIEQSKQKMKSKFIQTYLERNDNVETTWIGDDLSGKPHHETTRFILSNCKGFRIKRDTNFFKSQLQSYLCTGAHFVAFNEINFNIRKPGNRQRLLSLFNGIIIDGKFSVNNGPSLSDDDWQMGGSANMFYGRIYRRHSITEYDKAGRWVMDKFIGETRNICIYNVYRTNPGSDKSGETSVWGQQKEILREKNMHECDPRKQIVDDLIKDVRRKIQDKCAVIVMGDFNEKIDSIEGTNDRFESIGMVNMMQRRIGKLPKTFIGGSNAIDHVWMSNEVFPYVDKAGYAPFY